jgi:hypothetical protein
VEITVWVNLSPIRCTSDFFGVPFSRDDHMWGVFALQAVSAIMYVCSKARSEGRIHPTTQNSACYTCTRATSSHICLVSLIKRMCGHTYAQWGHRRREKGGDDTLWRNGQIGVSPPCISVSYTSGSLTRWMKATSGTDGGSPSNSTVRCMALGSGWKYGENFPKSQKRQE